MNKYFQQLATWGFLACLALPVQADEFIPRRQDKPPGPPLTPEQALAKMQVPEGFHVELVASEPDLLNPVAMTFDDRGRIWVTESFEYPRHEPGPGRDRIKILEDTDGDGRVDSVKIFAEGLNIPSGIAVGHGGVWVANAPDILFLEDTDSDDRADKSTVVVTGFGRYDTHELPNALTWGPDGWLYGLNGVFNPCHVEQDGRVFDFTCAMFRIHPKTRRFEIFAEGTSNPWGIAFDQEGSAFISACVIDHLWHLSETGYYHRQGGPYPPHTWKMESIVEHSHQMAAYCGIEYFDSPAYPESYRDKLYMGNIHGGCINVDRVERSGATYKGFGEPDFMTANDVWFMPVAQKVGPDGCLYILDWYDRFHCYQDASADPAGVDRGHGRLYRVVHGERPKINVPDVSKLDTKQLVALLSDPNIYYRQQAQLELAERASQDAVPLLTELATNSTQPLKTRMHAVWSLAGIGNVADATLSKLMSDKDAAVQAWGVRIAATQNSKSKSLGEQIAGLSADADARVRLQVAVAANKIGSSRASQLLMSVADHSQVDGIMPQIIWQNLNRHLSSNPHDVIAQIGEGDRLAKPVIRSLIPRIGSRLLSDVSNQIATDEEKQKVAAVLKMVSLTAKDARPEAGELLATLTAKCRSAEIGRDSLRPILIEWFKDHKISIPAEPDLLAYAFLESQILINDERAVKAGTGKMLERSLDGNRRIALLASLAIDHPEAIQLALEQLIEDSHNKTESPGAWKDFVLAVALDRGNADSKDKLFANLPIFGQATLATLAVKLAQREDTANRMLEDMIGGRLSKEIVSPNQVRLLAQSKSEKIRDQVTKIWGAVRVQDSKDRQVIVQQMAEFLTWEAKGNAKNGLAVYDRICGQCHILHERGYEVGPNITRNGRGSFEQMLVAVFDPSLVIGEAYRSVTVLTDSGHVVQGLLLEKSEQRIVLKVQGGKQTIIPINEVEEIKQNQKSLMPEGIEQQLSKQEMADLFALLCLEPSLESGEKSVIPGTPTGLRPSDK
jgi:putative membrane-bound dehydrogenase-like protein